MKTAPFSRRSILLGLSFRFVLGIVLGIGFSSAAVTYEVSQRSPQATDDGPGSTDQPWKTLAPAARKAAAGDTVLIHGGVYRESVVLKSSGTPEAPVHFEAAPGEQVILTGADQLTAWEKADGDPPIYHVPWPYRFNPGSKNMTYPDNEHHRLIGRCEQVMVNGYPLRQVLGSSQLAPGTFFADTVNRTLWAWDTANRDLRKAFVEASVRQEILHVQGDCVQLRGLRFRYAANPAHHDAVLLGGSHDAMEDCIIESMNACGADFAGEHVLVRRCVFRDNGQLGFCARRAHHLLFTDCLVENNNTKDFSRGWEAGGDKLVLCRDAVLERSRFLRNRGNGIWFDIGNENCTVRQCLIADNEDSGIFYEISFGLRAHDNVICGNGFASTAGAWGAQAGISLSSSPNCVIERNLIVGNREGFNFREQSRRTPTIDKGPSRPIWNHDQLIRHNMFVLNRDAQVWGWFDVKDNRQWPAGSQPSELPPARASAKPDDIAGPYAAQTSDGQPRDLTLEKLRLNFEHNLYFAAPGQGWFKWGVTWGRHMNLASLSEFQSNLGIDTAGQVLNPSFADLLQMDYRLPAEVLAKVKESYPEASVPGVQLGPRP
jgi:parallel beta-helix repeat protein